MKLISFSGRVVLLTTVLAGIAVAADKMVPLDVKLPGAAFKGTPTNIQTNSYTEPYSDAPPAPMMVPEGLQNLAPSAKLSTSSTNVSVEKLSKIVDGDKEAAEPSIVLLRKGTQYVQMDLGSPTEIF